jgi:hypothetical protein
MTKPKDGAAAAVGAATEVIAGPATDTVTAGTTVLGCPVESCRESKFRPIDVSCRLLATYYFSFHLFSCFETSVIQLCHH